MSDSRRALRSWAAWSGMLLTAAPAAAPAQVREIEFQPSMVFVRSGQTRLLRVGIEPPRYAAGDLSWSSQDESVARVDGAGLLTAVHAGSTNVWAQGGIRGEANEMGRVVVFDDSNSTRLALPDAAGPPPSAWRFEIQQQRDDIVALICRIEAAVTAQPVLKVRMDDGPELEVTAPGAAGEPRDVSPMFTHPFGGFYRFGLTTGRHVLTLTPLVRDLRIDDVRLVGETGAQDHYESHESPVMNQRRWYRVFLPPDYGTTRERLPVIYYLHGWGGRVFKEGVPGSHIDLGEVERRVARDHVIVVMTDGQVFWEGGEQFSRFAPYNVFLPHESPFLWEDYFAEIVRHIDATYRTVPDRSHRAVLGFSMGGLMSYRIAERFPQLVGAVNPFCGSTEAFFGTPVQNIYVRVSDLVENLHGVRLRIHDTGSDYLLAGNERVWRATQREELPDTEIAIFPGAHAVDPAGGRAGFNQAFDWAVAGFRHPQPPPARWHSMQFVPQFETWDYRVSCTPAVYGFTELHGVTPGGFRVATVSALPDGGARPGVTVAIETAPCYLPNTDYEVLDCRETNSQAERTVRRSDDAGRIRIVVDGAPHQIGIHRAGGPADVVVLGGLAGQNEFLAMNREAEIKVRLFNRGGRVAKGLTGFVTSPETDVTISRPDFAVATLAPGQVAELVVPVFARETPPPYAAPFALRFEIKVRSDSHESWRDELDVIPDYDAPLIPVAVEADGEPAPGKPPRDTAEPGETFNLRANGKRLRVFSDDSFLRKLADIPIVEPDDPENAAVYSRLQISPDCPHGHVVKCLVRTETVAADVRSVALEWGRAEIAVH
ncbi:MAG TPA: alpha/beta hydrolase-fold protein [Candidatus Didemnitutus sp.]|jgi:hypothetical protein